MTGRYKAYPEYKNSGVEWLGDVPIDWSISRLKFITSIFGRIGFRGYTTADIVDEGEGALVLSPSNVFDGQLDLNSKAYLSWDKYYESPEIIVEPDDILLVKTGSTYGKSAIVDDNYEPMTINPQMALLKQSKIPAKYLAYVMSSDLIKAIIEVSNTGSGMPTMTQENINSFPIPIPCQQGARKIANFLDHETTKIDSLITKQEKLIELLKEKRQVAISHVVTKGLNPDVPMKDSGVEWLGEVPEHWLIGRYKDCTKRIVVGIAEAATHAYTNVGVPLIRATNIKDDGFLAGSLLFLKENFAESNSSKYLFHNDIVTVRTGYPGISAVIPKHLDRSHCFTNLVSTPKEQHKSEFLAEFLNSHLGKAYFKLQGWGSAQQNISVPILESTPIAFPSLSEQIEIYTYIGHQRRKFKKLISFAESSIDLMQERKTALISAAVTGKIDVRHWQE